MKYGHIIISISLLVVGCSDTNNDTSDNNVIDNCKEVISEATDSTAMSKGKICNGLKEGLHKTYYENGSVKSTVNYCKDTLCGKLTFFLENGDTLAIEDYTRNTLVKNHVYWNYKEGYKEIRELCLYRNAKNWHKNEWRVYSLEGKLMKDHSRFYEVINAPKTFRHNSSDSISIKLTAPYYGEGMFIDMGNFDQYYNITDSTSVVRIQGDNNLIAKIPLSTSKEGVNRIRFVINDYINYSDSDSSANYVQSLPLLGMFEYEVTKN